MQHFFQRKMVEKQLIGIYLFMIIILSILTFYNWIIGVIFACLAIVVLYDYKRRERIIQKEQITFLTELSFQVENAGKDVFLKMPIGIIIYSENYQVEWANAYIYELNNQESFLGKSLTTFSDKFIPYITGEEDHVSVKINESDVKLSINRANRTLYLQNETMERKLVNRLENERVIVASVMLDNYYEIFRNLADDVRGKINANLTATLNKWADDSEVLLKRVSQDRYFAIFTRQTLAKLEKSKFNILDTIRELHVDETQRNPITLSIGVGVGTTSIPDLASLAQSALDVSLGRGGDQVTIRNDDGSVRFYGGKTNPMEKRTRVRARVVSHALKELVKESDNVIIMGHKSPDMDSLGSSIGVLNIAESNDVPGYIVFDEADVTIGVNRVIEKIKENKTLWDKFVSPTEAETLYTGRSLVVVVDTHIPSLVVNEKLLMNAEYKVIIDHHRRSEEFIDNPTLVYMEPYASSASELVTELIEYQPKKQNLTTLEATSLLAGIIVDTKSFAFRTGTRTFDAASYLRLKGADPILVQELLKDDLSTYIRRNKLIERSYMYEGEIAIVRSDEADVYSHITIAQAADTLLTMNHVQASFVISKSSLGVVSVSARSLGGINVQVIMEEMHGGGHLTNAATQIKGMSVEEVEQLLLQKLEIHYKGEEK